MRTTTYTFNEDGTLATATGEMADGVSGGSEFERTYEYDELGRESRSVSHQTSPQDYVTISQVTYRGQTSQFEKIEYTRGPSVDEQAPLQTATYEYNSQGLPARVEHVAPPPDNSVISETTISYSGDYRSVVVEDRGPGGDLYSKTERRYDQNWRID